MVFCFTSTLHFTHPTPVSPFYPFPHPSLNPFLCTETLPLTTQHLFYSSSTVYPSSQPKPRLYFSPYHNPTYTCPTLLVLLPSSLPETMPLYFNPYPTYTCSTLLVLLPSSLPETMLPYFLLYFNLYHHPTYTCPTLLVLLPSSLPETMPLYFKSSPHPTNTYAMFVYA